MSPIQDPESHPEGAKPSEALSEPRYTLNEAKAKLALDECFTYGHDLSVVSTGAQIGGGGDLPTHVVCDRCEKRWPVGDPSHHERLLAVRNALDEYKGLKVRDWDDYRFLLDRIEQVTRGVR